MDIKKIERLCQEFSVIAVGQDKRPAHKWKQCQTSKMTIQELTPYFEAGNSVGIVTGFEDLECIDVDLKVFSTAKEQKEFWDEYLGLLQDNILDFKDKFVIYKTLNAGYHILYKSKRVQGNIKIATLKDHKEAVIETRGIGGYIFTYPKNSVNKTYYDIQYISDEDRDILFQCSKIFNHVEDVVEPIKVKKDKRTDYGDLTPWDDYNQRNDIFSVIGDEFSVVGNVKNKYIIKRHGATSAHSGYVFKDTGTMYLFSTGTIYQHEKLYTPFTAYAQRYHGGDLSLAAKQVYADGYGSRIVKDENEPKETIVINKDDLEFPLDIFPKPIQSYLVQCSQTLDSSIDYMGCALIWVLSLSIGNSIQIEVKRGWREIATLWIAIVGKAGIGKTPSISNIIFPLEKINNREIANYIKQFEEYEEYQKLTAKEQKEYPEVKKPIKTQFLANDITVEALVDLHQQSQNSVGVFKDELAGWFKDMNKYKQGSDLEFWLSTWSGKAVNLNRLTRAGSFVSNPLIPVLGGIQPSIFNSFYTEENKDNGFIDRMLLSYPDLQVEKYNDEEMSYEVINWFSDTIINFYDNIRYNVINRNAQGKIEPLIMTFSPEAKKEWIRIFNEITEVQNSDAENEYMKSMLPKQKSYIPRFALLLHSFDCRYNQDLELLKVSKESILKAEKLSKYFIAMAKKVKIDSIEVREIKNVIKDNKGKSNFDLFKTLYEANPNLNKKEVSEQLGVSLQMIYKYIKQLKNEV